MPRGLGIRESQIPGAGDGVWTDMFLPKAVRFGPYEGELLFEEDVAHESGYCWQVCTQLKLCTCTVLCEFIHYLHNEDQHSNSWKIIKGSNSVCRKVQSENIPSFDLIFSC